MHYIQLCIVGDGRTIRCLSWGNEGMRERIIYNRYLLHLVHSVQLHYACSLLAMLLAAGQGFTCYIIS